PKQNILQETTPQQQQQLTKIFNEIKQALDLSSQAIHQAKLAHPNDYQLPIAEQRLVHAVQLIQQLQTAAPDLTTGLSKVMKQQLAQVSQQINNASNTLQLIQQSIQSN